MDDLKGTGMSETGSLLNQAPTMSVEEPAQAAAVGVSLPVRMLRAALAGLAIAGIGYAALASSPALSQSFTNMTGLSIGNQAASSAVFGASCSSSAGSCGAMAESCCSDGMAPYAEVSGDMTCATSTCPSMSATLVASGCCDSAGSCDSTGSCCASGQSVAVACTAGVCPSETATNDVVEGEVAVGSDSMPPAVDEYIRAAQTTTESEETTPTVNE